MSTDEPDEWVLLIRQQVEQMQADRAAHLAEYRELKLTPRRFRERLRVSYHCQDRDAHHLLLDVWIDSAGRPWRYQPRYRIPKAREAEESNAEGRAKNKTGEKWNEQIGPLIDEAGGRVELQCQHCKQFVSNAELIALVADAEKARKPKHLRV